MEDKMEQIIERLQLAVDRKIEYSEVLNRKINRLHDKLRKSISKQEYDAIIAKIR